MVLESQPFGHDDVETQVHPLMEDLAKAYSVEEPLKGFVELPNAPTAALT